MLLPSGERVRLATLGRAPNAAAASTDPASFAMSVEFVSTIAAITRVRIDLASMQSIREIIAAFRSTAQPVTLAGKLTQQFEGSPSFQRAIVGGAAVDAPEPGQQLRALMVQSAACGRCFDHEAHLDVGCRELFAREPRALFQFVLHELLVRPQLRFNKGLQHAAAYAARDRAHDERHRPARQSAENERE